jgi:Domain of unknown function (DUF5122) beta-propeller
MRFMLITIVSLTAACQTANAQDCDPHWETFNGGVNGTILSMVNLPNGDIVVGGEFSVAGGVPAHNIARWDGAAWHPLGEGVDGWVPIIRARANGRIVVLGNYSSTDGVNLQVDLREWDGTAWNPIPLTVGGRWPLLANSVSSMFVLRDDSLIIFGQLTTLNQLPITTSARFAGGTWTQHGSPGSLGSLWPSEVTVLLESENGAMRGFGTFRTVANDVRPTEASFDGQVWREVTTPTPSAGRPKAYFQADDGSEYIGGNMLFWNGQNGPLLKRRNGVISQLAPSTHTGHSVNAFSRMNSQRLLVGGSLPDLNNIAILDGDILRPIGTGTNGTVTTILELPNRKVVIGGSFTSVGGQPAGGIAASWPFQDVLISRQPTDQSVTSGSTATFSLEAVQQGVCPTPMSFQWQRRDPRIEDPNASNAWIDLINDGNFINTTQQTCSILSPTASLATGFRCRITSCTCRNPTYSDVVNFNIACPADFNADGGVDFNDVEAFFERWQDGC